MQRYKMALLPFATTLDYATLANLIMASKQTLDSSDSSKKRKTKVVNLDVIKRLEQGETQMNIGQLLGLSPMNVSTIIGDKKRILERLKGSGLVTEMERLLLLWLEDQQQRCILPSQTKDNNGERTVAISLVLALNRWSYVGL